MLNFLAGLIWRCRVKKVMVYGYNYDQIAVQLSVWIRVAASRLIDVFLLSASSTTLAFLM